MLNSFPSYVLELKVVQTVEDTITSEYNEIVQTILNSELSYLRLSYHYASFASILFKLGFNISEGSRNTKPPR